MDDFQNETPTPSESLGAQAKKTFSGVGWAFTVMLAASNGLQILLYTLGNRRFPELFSSEWTTWLLSIVPLYCVALPLGWLILRRLPAVRPAENSLPISRLAELLVMAFAIMYIGNLIGVALNVGIASAKGTAYENPVYELLRDSNIWANLVCVAILAPVLEELVFRKLLCDRVRVYGERTAILVSGLVFGLFHGNLSQFFYAFAVGMFFAYVYLRTGRIRYTMLLHACMNLLGGVLPEVILKHIDLDAISKLSTDSVQEQISYAQGHLGELVGFGLYALTVFALFILGIVFLAEHRKTVALQPTEKQLPPAERGVSVKNAGMLVYLIITAGLMVFTAITA
ncbi:MAG: CPBP family intramembrane glutamic endopeptidase [Oscillospiraceae bacterium]